MIDFYQLEDSVTEEYFWNYIDERLYEIARMLFDTRVETREEAMSLSTKEAQERRGAVLTDVLYYSGVSEDNDNFDYYRKMGQKVFDEVALVVGEERRITPKFICDWGLLTFCHGYIMSYYFNDSDPMATARAGRKGGEAVNREPQRRWFAHILLHFWRGNVKRIEAESKTLDCIVSLLKENKYAKKFGKDWYMALLNKNIIDGDVEFELRTTYVGKSLSRKTLTALRDKGLDGIPPLPPGIPN